MTKKNKNRNKNSDNVIHLRFDDNNLAQDLFGPEESHLKSLENHLGVDINARGGQVSVSGDEEKIQLVSRVLTQLYGLLKKGHPVLAQDIERAVRIVSDDRNAPLNDMFLESILIPARKKVIYPRTPGQKNYLAAIMKDDIVFGVGPAGTGKTYLAMAMAVVALLKGDVERIILTRPAIEAGEKLGFLPGDLVEKVNPYLRPLYDALHDMIDIEKAKKMLERGEIEVAPLAFMRGRTLNDAFVILDEAQNCTVEQMKMFLTRIGFRSKAVITGDVTQIDLPREKRSGLIHAIHILKEIPGISLHYLSDNDVVRHALVREIIRAYDKDNAFSDTNKERVR